MELQCAQKKPRLYFVVYKSSKYFSECVQNPGTVRRVKPKYQEKQKVQEALNILDIHIVLARVINFFSTIRFVFSSKFFSSLCHDLIGILRWSPNKTLLGDVKNNRNWRGRAISLSEKKDLDTDTSEPFSDQRSPLISMKKKYDLMSKYSNYEATGACCPTFPRKEALNRCPFSYNEMSMKNIIAKSVTDFIQTSGAGSTTIKFYDAITMLV